MRDVRMALAGCALAVGVLSLAALPAPAAAAPAPDLLFDEPEPASKDAEPAPKAADASSEAAEPASELVARFTAWVIAAGDHGGAPFAVIDKIRARVFVFAADGRMIGEAPVLIGSALGDDSAPGVGELALGAIPPKDRTTPAGRFRATFGPAEGATAPVLWIDYDAAVSLHPVITTNRKQRRLQRLASETPLDNRITYGCINVPAAFYEDVIRPVFGGADGVVYVLPETRELEAVFPAFRWDTGDGALIAAAVEGAAERPARDADEPREPRARRSLRD